MNAVDIVEQIMTQHWDLKSCECWVCHAGRKAGLRPKDIHLKNKHPDVEVKNDYYCSKCKQAWMVHNDDGSCVDDEKP